MKIKAVNRFFYRLWYEWLKIQYKPTQFYYTNKIQSKTSYRERIGAGQVFVFCNKKVDLYELQELLDLPDDWLYNIKGFPCLKVIGSKISNVRLSPFYKNLPQREIIDILKRQKTDKI